MRADKISWLAGREEYYGELPWETLVAVPVIKTVEPIGFAATTIVPEDHRAVAPEGILQYDALTLAAQAFIEPTPDPSLPPPWTLFLQAAGYERDYNDRSIGRFLPSLKARSVTNDVVIDRMRYIATGSRGSFTITARASFPLTIDFNGLGLFNGLSEDEFDWDSRQPATYDPLKACGVTLTLTERNSGEVVTFIVSEFSFRHETSPFLRLAQRSSTSERKNSILFDNKPVSALSFLVESSTEHRFVQTQGIKVDKRIYDFSLQFGTGSGGRMRIYSLPSAGLQLSASPALSRSGNVSLVTLTYRVVSRGLVGGVGIEVY